MPLTQRRKHHRIRRRAIEYEKHFARRFKDIGKQAPGLRGVSVRAVARGSSRIRLVDGVERLRTDAGRVVTRKGVVPGKDAHGKFVFGNGRRGRFP
jgi:hypothetical protein